MYISCTGLSLNIKPSWAPLASLNGSTASLDRTTTSSHVSSGAKGKGIERQSSLAEDRSAPPAQPSTASSKICQNTEMTILSCPLCDCKCSEGPSKVCSLQEIYAYILATT